MAGEPYCTPTIEGPVHPPARPRTAPPPGAVDAHAHLFGPQIRFPFTDGRGYTPPDAPVTKYLEMLDTLGLACGLMVQGNAHGMDNSALMEGVAQHPDRLRAIGIVDASAGEAQLRAWHRQGMRGLRFHLFHPDHRPAYVRGVGLDVHDLYRTTMRDLGWAMQVWCDWRTIEELEPMLQQLGREHPLIIDHMLNVDAQLGPDHPAFACLLRLVGAGHIWVKLSGAYRVSRRHPDYPDARPLHAALVRVNPERLLWGTDWPHPIIDDRAMPDDGSLFNLFCDWTPDARIRRMILSENPRRLFDFPPVPTA